MTENPKTTPLARIANGYRATTAAVEAKRTARVASGFRPSDRMEKLIAMRQRDPTTYAQLDVTTRMAVGMYEGTKRAAHQEDDHGNDAA